MTFPGKNLEQAQGHARVLGALMLEEQVEDGLAWVESNVEAQIALGTRELRVDERARFESEGGLVEGSGEFFGEMVFEEGAGVLGDGEGGFEEFVVGLVDGVLSHGKGR